MGGPTAKKWRAALARSTTSLAFWLALVLVFTLPWRGAIRIGQIGTIGRMIGAVVGAVWVLSVLFRLDVRLPSWFHIGLGALVCWSAMSLLWTIDAGETLETTLRYGLIWAILLALWDLFRTPEDIEYALQAYVVGSFVVVGAVFYNFSVDAIVYANRFSAFGLNPNIIARMLVLGAPLAWYLSLRSRASILANPLVRSINVSYLALAGSAIALTGARQGMVGFAVTLVYVAGTAAHDVFDGVSSVSHRWIALQSAVLAAGIAIAVYVLAVATDIGTRVFQIPAEITSGSFNNRSQTWDASIEVMSQRPLVGHGSGTFVPAVEPLFSTGDVPVAAHNAFFQLGVELGLVGIAIYTALLIGTAVVVCLQATRYRTLWATVFSILLVFIAIEGIVANVVKYLLFMFAVSTAAIHKGDAARHVVTVREWGRFIHRQYSR